MQTNIHIKHEGAHRTFQFEGFFEHKEVVGCLAEHGVVADDGRVMLTYKKSKSDKE